MGDLIDLYPLGDEPLEPIELLKKRFSRMSSERLLECMAVLIEHEVLRVVVFVDVAVELDGVPEDDYDDARTLSDMLLRTMSEIIERR